MERFYYGSSIAGFLKESESSILGKLGTADGFGTTRDQMNAWVEEVPLLQSILTGIEGWIFFEYSIPRLGKRVDVVLLVKGTVLCLEFKAEAERFETADREQVWDYALDLKTSTNRAAICSLRRFWSPRTLRTSRSNSGHAIAMQRCTSPFAPMRPP